MKTTPLKFLLETPKPNYMKFPTRLVLTGHQGIQSQYPQSPHKETVPGLVPDPVVHRETTQDIRSPSSLGLPFNVLHQIAENNNNSPLVRLVAGGCSRECWEPERDWEDECSSSTEDSGLSDTGAKEICVSRSRNGEKDSLVGSMSWSWLMMSLMDSFMLSSSFAFCLLAAWRPAVLIVTRPEENLGGGTSRIHLLLFHTMNGIFKSFSSATTS